MLDNGPSDDAQSELWKKLGIAASGGTEGPMLFDVVLTGRSLVVPAAYANDPKYKKYTQQVEKCLSSFDSVHEWADFISFLKQLLKVPSCHIRL
jgi:hypothetical protein